MTSYTSFLIVVLFLFLCITAYYLVQMKQSTERISKLEGQVLSAPKYAVGSPVYVFVAGKWVEDIIIESKLSGSFISIRTRSMESGTFYPITSEYVRLVKGNETTESTEI